MNVLNKFRKSFYATFFDCDLKAKDLSHLNYTTTIYFRGDSLEHPRNYDIIGKSNYEIHGISFKYHFAKKKLSLTAEKMKCYYLFVQDMDKNSAFIDSISGEWKIKAESYVDSLIKQEIFKSSLDSSNELCVYKTKPSNRLFFYLQSKSGCFLVKARVFGRKDRQFLKKFDHKINLDDLITSLLGTNQYCEKFENEQNIEIIKSNNCYQLFEK